MFNDANIFTVEINYDNTGDVVTQVRGHGWAYDGRSAWRAESERWLDEKPTMGRQQFHRNSS